MKSECGNKSHCWCKVSFAFGITGALSILFLGLMGTYCGHGLSMISVIGSLYPGFAATVYGSFVGAFWAFLDTFLFFLISGWIYCGITKMCNKCFCCGSQCRTSECKTEENKIDKTLDT